MDIRGQIKEIKYKYFLRKNLKSHKFSDLDNALYKDATLFLKFGSHAAEYYFLLGIGG